MRSLLRIALSLVLFVAGLRTTQAQRSEVPAPGPNVPPGMALVAIESLPGPDSWPIGKVLTTDTDHERRIRGKLEEPFTHDFKGLKLADLVPLLEKRLQCTVVLQLAALAADGKEPEKIEFHGKAQGRALRKELRALLDPHELKAFVHNDCCFITTTIAAGTYDEVRVYQVHDLVVAANDVIAAEPDFIALEEILQAQLFAETWRSNGGTTGEVRAFRGPGVFALVISHTAETHDRIENFFAQLRAAKVPEVAKLQQSPIVKVPPQPMIYGNYFGGMGGVPLYARGPIVPPPPRLPRGKVLFRQTEEERRIHEALRKPSVLKFVDERLDVIAETIAKRHNIPVEIDVAALTADGKGAESKVSFEWTSGSLGDALKTMLEQHGLTSVVRNDAMLLTTKTASETFEEVRVYQVHDLLASDSTRIGEKASYENFAEMITAVISPETWEGSGTTSNVVGVEASGIQCLSIKQTSDVHEEIESLLDMLRDAFVPEVYEAQRRRPIVVPPPTTDVPTTTPHPGGIHVVPAPAASPSDTAPSRSLRLE
ncbi:MAG: hypothetical protein QM775_23540 [Pirellulales bacterium]